eukprot:1161241-Pelagomonas_calceolata.AAC.5
MPTNCSGRLIQLNTCAASVASAPRSVLDASGNWNNVLQVSPTPPILTSKERLSVARWHAMLIAFEAKMGLGV